MTGDFRRIVWTIAHLPASACTTSAPGSKSPLGRGGGGGAAPLGVLPGFPVVGVRLCASFACSFQSSFRATSFREILLAPHSKRSSTSDLVCEANTKHKV